MSMMMIICGIVLTLNDIILLVIGAILGVIATKVNKGYENLSARIRNRISLMRLPVYNPINDNICPIRLWNTNNSLDEKRTVISYDEKRAFNSLKPDISSCPFISDKAEWQKLYRHESEKEKKKKGKVSYATYVSPDHNDTEKGRKFELKVSTCDYLGHQVNGMYFKEHHEDWEKIKQIIVNGNLNEYFSHAMPGNIFVNMIIINGVTNKMLVVKRSNSELNARNVWCIGGFETMNDLSHAINGSEEFTLHGITRRGLREEFTLEPHEIQALSISSIAFVKHLGLMVTALVRVDLGIEPDGENNILTEGGLIERIMKRADSAFEHSVLKWMPISLKQMRNYIRYEKGYYRDVICEGYSTEEKWIGYAKWEMCEIWRNHASINIIL